MGVIDIVKEALRIARTHKSLWLFGFLVGLGGGFNFGGGGGGQPAPPAVPGGPPDPARIVLVIIVALAVIAVFVVLKFLATGALIEGVRRARGNGAMTLREGFREGWAHWGVLFRVALLYLPLYFGSVLVLGGASVLVFRAFGMPAGVVAASVAVLVGVPWLLTLYMWQAFAERIAVFENRRALDAIAKARLFLHGRLQLGLKLLVAGFLGVLLVSVVGVLVIAPLTAIVAASAGLWGALGAVGLGAVTLAPLVFVAVAFAGIMTSSVWTIGYLSQVEQ
ncbi:MAG TPA: hypothetical protein VF405_11625 [Gammaproteobacteria bacterium]